MSPYRSAAEAVRERIERACESSQRDHREVKVVAVTKTRSTSEIRACLEESAGAGLRVHALGENRVQEALAKQADMGTTVVAVSGEPGIPWHMIGRVQTNKVRQLAGRFALVHGLDRGELVDVFARRAPDLPVLIQVNTTGEATKAGVAESGASALLSSCLEAGLRVEGLMTMAPHGDPEAADAAFGRLRRLRERLRAEFGSPLDELSMGMTDDFESAIRHGSTLVRLGRVLFGERDRGPRVADR